MSSSVYSDDLGNKKSKMLIWALWLFIAVPIVWFLVLLARGIYFTLSDRKPQDVVAVQITKSTATITWITSTPSVGNVEYGTSPSNLIYNAEEIEPKKEHEVNLTILSPQTIYYYQITIDGKVYDNDGLPWNFTTKTKDGADLSEAVKGVSTRKLVEDDVVATKEAIFGTSQCTSISCDEIKANLGKGCSASDYFKCIANIGANVTISGASSQFTSPTPTPTPVAILLSQCAISYLYANNGCVDWTWEPYLKKVETCTQSFDKYVLQCADKNPTSTNSQDVPNWRYDYVETNMATNTVKISNKPPDGKTIWCEIRAEDTVGGDGHATPWVIKEVTCPSSTPTPTPTPTP